MAVGFECTPGSGPWSSVPVLASYMRKLIEERNRFLKETAEAAG